MGKYSAKQPDAQGHIHWDDTENKTWHTLYERQVKIIEQHACDEFIDGVKCLKMSSEHVPQLAEINRELSALTGWSVQAVPAMITPTEFFQLLSEKKFPAATFIRSPEEMDYLQEPDIFHEIFGHCPMITHQAFSDFMQHYGEKALVSEHQSLLARLFWFTVEFGLIHTPAGLRCYGGGILSSAQETVYAIENPVPQRKPFNVIDILRTPYRVDQLQGTYFVLDDFEQLTDLLSQDLDAMILEAKALGEFDLVEIDHDASKSEWSTC